MVAVLTLTTALVGAILGSIYQITAKPIALASAQAQEEAIRQVTPAFDNNPIAESDTIHADGMPIVIYPAKQGNENVGAAVKVTTMNGFNGEIVVMVGFEHDGTIREYRVLSHGETPGLGAKMEQWFRTDKNQQNIVGKNPANTNLKVTKDGGDIDGITASTITSRAFLQTIQIAYNAYMQQPVDGISGSSTATDAVSGSTATDADSGSSTSTDAVSGSTATTDATSGSTGHSTTDNQREEAKDE